MLQIISEEANSSIGGVWNVNLGYCKKQLLKQLFFSKRYAKKFIEKVGQYF